MMIDIQLMQNTSELIMIWLVIMTIFIVCAITFIVLMHKRISDLFNKKR